MYLNFTYSNRENIQKVQVASLGESVSTGARTLRCSADNRPSRRSAAWSDDVREVSERGSAGRLSPVSSPPLLPPVVRRRQCWRIRRIVTWARAVPGKPPFDCSTLAAGGSPSSKLVTPLTFYRSSLLSCVQDSAVYRPHDHVQTRG